MPLYNHIESQEMYLKAILELLEKSPYVRAIDVSEKTGYAKSSVSRALMILERDNYIVRDEDRVISFTEKGRKTAEFVHDRYNVLLKILLDLGLDEEEAERTACETEHYFTKDVYLKLKTRIENK